MNRIDNILCKTDLHHFRDGHISANPSTMYNLKHVLNPPKYLCGIYNFNKGVSSFYVKTLL